MKSRYCHACQKQVRSEPIYEVNHVAHLLASVCLCGLWLPLWVLAAFLSYVQGVQCPICGAKV